MIEALSGSCLQIPCSFSSMDSSYNNTGAVFGIWLRKSTKFDDKPSPVIFNSSGSVNTYSLKFIGNLKKNDCTTLFPDLNSSYTDKYFLRIQNWPFKATAVCQPFQITVKGEKNMSCNNIYKSKTFWCKKVNWNSAKMSVSNFINCLM